MRKLRLKQVLCAGLLTAALGIGPAKAEDYGGQSSNAIDWTTSYRGATDEAIQSGKPMLVRITASWCGPCQQMKQLTFTDSRVVQLVRSNFVPLLIDADANPDLVTGFRIEAYPTTLVVSADLTVMKRMKGFQSADSLVSTLTPLAKSQPGIESVTDLPQAVSALDPVNAVKFGFDGYCLVSLLEETKVRKGSVEFVAEYRGQAVCFQTEEHRQRFLAEPEKYWPVANGQCLVSSREGFSAGPGDPRMAVTWRGKIWMFSDRERQKRFIQSPFLYASEM